jgi:cation diffusion facilitator family transporter
VLNFIVARVLLRASQQYRSVALEADAHHLLTDVWTSAGVLLGVGAVALTNWQPLDAIIAILVGVQIMVSGWRMVRKAALGLMDTALPAGEVGQVTAVLDRYCQNGVSYHALRTRQSGQQRFVSFHIQVPGEWSVQRGHALLEEIERDIRAVLLPITVFTHLEPSEDPVSWHDMVLNRQDGE